MNRFQIIRRQYSVKKYEEFIKNKGFQQCSCVNKKYLEYSFSKFTENEVELILNQSYIEAIKLNYPRKVNQLCLNNDRIYKGYQVLVENKQLPDDKRFDKYIDYYLHHRNK